MLPKVDEPEDAPLLPHLILVPRSLVMVRRLLAIE